MRAASQASAGRGGLATALQGARLGQDREDPECQALRSHLGPVRMGQGWAAGRSHQSLQLSLSLSIHNTGLQGSARLFGLLWGHMTCYRSSAELQPRAALFEVYSPVAFMQWQ